MTFARGLLLLGVLAALPARAELPVLSSSALTSGGVYLQLGTRELGAGIKVPPSENRVWVGEVTYAPSDSVLHVAGALQHQLTPRVFVPACDLCDGGVSRASFFNVSTQGGVDLLATTRGPLSLGLGPNVGVSLGLGRDLIHGFLGLQSGAQIFPVGGPPLFRFPLRVVLGAALRTRHVEVEIFGRAGVDLFTGELYALRYDAVLALGWR